ncbi:hypothetical protein DEQ92_18080 [Haloferax sp. Atlit-6N]|uniref:hypothetical protein n=1 Tax=Haloferax sp. Atlit-6N TaxID=2077205 RepID=UPI000E222EBB|nr:hypothetical protein [Haloferax sp. Atlit-6N]REA01258.1 hypothetical protein DEQ92_18080 [Haloferax sp. Atlit-6N]
MSESQSKINEGERDALGAIAGDALKVFRAGLFMIVIYISILSLTLRTGGVDYIENIIGSFYTINGIVFWVGSITSSVLTHRMARRVTLQEHYSQLGRIDDKFDVLNFATAGTVGLLISVLSLIFGLLEGWSNTVNPSAGGIGIDQPLLIVGFSLLFVLSIYTFFSFLDMVRDRWGSIRNLLGLSG